MSSACFRCIEHADLRARNTFAVPARARLLVEVDDAAGVEQAFVQGAIGPDAMVLGGGSNLLLAGDPPQPLLSLRGQRIGIAQDDGGMAIVRAEAGTSWHALVLWTLEHGLSGLQNLALIPGTVGAAPIQNIGAYGVEIGECVHAVEAWDRAAARLVRMHRDDCAFAYRDSVFKQRPDAFVVVAVEFALSHAPTLRLDYAGIGEELAAMRVARPGPRDVAEAVIRLRRRKLPDPARIGNAGSFFKNPLVPVAQAEAIHAQHPALPVFPAGDEALRKLSAAWLIEQCGWKGHRDGDAGVSAQHALVLVNHGQATGLQLLDLARRIAATVQARFGVAIEPEPRIVGAQW